MNNMKNQFLIVSMLLSLGLVTACDSSSGGGGPAPNPMGDETFQVGLVDLDVRRISNGDTVTVDTTGITGDEMTLEQ